MSRNVAISAKTSNAGAEELFGQSRNDLRLTDGLMRVARSLWPTKTAAELSVRTGVCQRTCENWLALSTGISGPALAALIASEDGLPFLEATIVAKGRSIPIWWKAFKRRQKREQLRVSLKQLQHELELNEQD